MTDALGLDRPVLLGCSMGGAIALYLAARHGERFTGVCALEGGLGSPGRFVDWTRRGDVDHSAFLTSWVGGLIAPASPAGPSAQTLWGYAQSGPGVYQGDTHFYSTDFPRHSTQPPLRDRERPRQVPEAARVGPERRGALDRRPEDGLRRRAHATPPAAARTRSRDR